MENSTSSAAAAAALENPIISAASSSGTFEETFEDACSICLEPFNPEDAATITSCKHDYHLQCIMEWSQRSKECPICWQLLTLRDPASQELLVAVQAERRLRSRNISPATVTTHHLQEDFDVDHDTSYSDDSDFDERIMQQLAAVSSRSRYYRRRESQRSLGLGPSQAFVFSSPDNTAPFVQHTHATSPGESQNISYESSESNSPPSGVPSPANTQPPSSLLPSLLPSVMNLVSSTAVDRDGPFEPRVINSPGQADSPRRPSPSEMFSFPEVKSRLSAVSARYKESISKGTRSFKEKLLACNNSVKELSKGVKREMSPGIAGVARMFEGLDLTSKKSGAAIPMSNCPVGTSNSNVKGKDVQENATSQPCSKDYGDIAHNLSSDEPTYVSGTI